MSQKIMIFFPQTKFTFSLKNQFLALLFWTKMAKVGELISERISLLPRYTNWVRISSWASILQIYDVFLYFEATCLKWQSKLCKYPDSSWTLLSDLYNSKIDSVAYQNASCKTNFHQFRLIKLLSDFSSTVLGFRVHIRRPAAFRTWPAQNTWIGQVCSKVVVAKLGESLGKGYIRTKFVRRKVKLWKRCERGNTS